MNKCVGLKNAVEAELAWIPSADVAHIGVSAESGIVVLSRHVPTYAQDLTVEEAVKPIMGRFGHARVREFVLGGATQSFLEAPPCPVLMSH